MASAFHRFESMLFGSNRRLAALTLAGTLVAGALAAALLVAAAGPLYALAGVLIVIGGLLVLRWTHWGFVALLAVVAVLPFAALPFQLGFTPTFLDVALLAIYFVWIVRIATRRTEGSLIGTALGGPILLLLLWTVFAFANGMRFSRPTPTVVRNLAELTLGIGLFFVVVNTVRREGELHALARWIMILGAGAATIAIAFYVIPPAWTVRVLDALGRFNYPGGSGALRYIEDDPANPMRAIGTMVDPNVLGGFLILITALTLPQVVSPQPLFRRRWVLLLVALDLLALYLTYSRGSLVGLAAGLLLIAVLRYRKLLWLIPLGLVLLLLLPPTQAYVTHFIEGIQLQDRATLMRLGEYRDALSLISRYPSFGVGFTGSPDPDLYVGVSNLYLLMAEEIGAVGLLIFLAIMVIFFASLGRAWRRNTSARPEPRFGFAGTGEGPLFDMEALLLGLLAAVTGVLVGGIFDHYLFNLVYPHMATLFWVYIGLGMSATNVVRTSMASRQLPPN